MHRTINTNSLNGEKGEGICENGSEIYQGNVADEAEPHPADEILFGIQS